MLTTKQHPRTSKKSKGKAPGFRLQGTDGIRCETTLSSSPKVGGLTPQEAFLKRGVITEKFMELYAFAHIKQLMRDGTCKTGDGIVIGWDPRDPSGEFTSAAISGIRKAGANALTLGVVPTPLVPMYLLYKKARGGFMITASHNPKDQNGIKTFCSFRGLKLLPQNDETLTRAVLETRPSQLNKLTLRGKQVDCRREALELFSRFSLAPENTWVPLDRAACLFKDITLVVDAANGSLSKIAADTFRRAGFGKVVELNARLNGNVNLNSGVADLEGKPLITREMVRKGAGLFSRHRAILKLLELGHKHRRTVATGKQRICGAVFDADGDRFYRLEYDPSKDALLVLSGDETAFLQARYLVASDPSRYAGTNYINTVESDLNITIAVEALGLRPTLTAVGDKWILLRIANLITETRICNLKKQIGGTAPLNAMIKKWQSFQKSDTLDIMRFYELESKVDALGKKNKKTGHPMGLESESFSFAVGSEETGHNITTGYLASEDGGRVPVFFGNGLKSAINTFAATQLLLGSKSVRTYFSTLRHPFPPGFKKTLYTYYVKKELFHLNSAVWNRLKKVIYEEGRGMGFKPRIIRFSEELDMLYVSLTLKNGSRASVFVRNSGTENKTSINLRGAKRDGPRLKKIGLLCIRVLLSTMKDSNNPFHRIESVVLNQVVTGPVPEARLKLDKESGSRVLTEMIKQGLISLTVKGYALTPLGKWYSAQQRPKLLSGVNKQ